MSTRTKILLLTIPAAFLLVAAFSALLLTNLVDSNLQNSRHLAALASQQTKEMLLMRLEEASKLGAASRDSWTRAIAEDTRLTTYLVNSVAQAPSLVEISVADQGNRIIASSTESIQGSQLKVRPPLTELLALGPIDRIRRVRNQNQDYELRVPIGLLNDPRPIFTVQVLVSMTLVDSLIRGGLQWIAVAGLSSLFLALVLVSLLAGVVSRDLRRIEQNIDLIRQGEVVPEVNAGAPSPEFAAVQSKLSLLGAEMRDTARTAADYRSRVNAALERLEEGILLFDSDGHLTLAGGASERLLQRRLDNFAIAGSPIDAPLRDVFRNRRSMPEQPLDWPTPRGAVTLLTAIDYVADSYALVRLRDPEGRRQLESQMELLSRLDGINRLTGGVAHEIKNPLNSIAARLGLLETMVDPDSEEAQEEIRVIGYEVERLDRVVRTFLDFTRPVELVQKELDIAALAAEVAAMVRPDAARRSIEVGFHAEPELVLLWGDEDILRQALMNLVVNAIDAMPEGGALTFTVSLTNVHEAEVVVADTGVGITPEQSEKIFQLYFTTKKNGSGIGLAMVYRAVQLHGGNIEVESEPGRGTRFELTFPALVKT